VFEYFRGGVEMKINLYEGLCGNIYALKHDSQSDITSKSVGTYPFYTYEIQEPKPIINPHLNPKKPSYAEAIYILNSALSAATHLKHVSVKDLLRDLGFQEGDE
jgi:hypothetical protein